MVNIVYAWFVKDEIPWAATGHFKATNDSQYFDTISHLGSGPNYGWGTQGGTGGHRNT